MLYETMAAAAACFGHESVINYSCGCGEGLGWVQGGEREGGEGGEGGKEKERKGRKEKKREGKKGGKERGEERERKEKRKERKGGKTWVIILYISMEMVVLFGYLPRISCFILTVVDLQPR